MLVLTISQDEDDLLEALRAGATGYVQKDSGKSVFLRSIRHVLAGEAALSARHTTSLVVALRRTMEQLEQAAVHIQDDNDLTSREREVLSLLAEGASNEEISRRLAVSLYTTKTHVRNILQKLDAGNRRDAVRVALQRGLIGMHRE